MSLVALGMALIDAVKCGDRETAANLLDAGVDPNTADLFDGLPALEHARRAGHDEIVRLLQNKGAEAEERPSAELAPAARAALQEVIALLAGPGAQIAECLVAPGAAVSWQVTLLSNKKGGR